MTEVKFLSLEINLPEGFRLSSIQAFYTGQWIVGVCRMKVGEWIGEDYAVGYDEDINVAAQRAVEKCERNREERLAGQSIDGRVVRHGSQASPRQTLDGSDRPKLEAPKNASDLGL